MWIAPDRKRLQPWLVPGFAVGVGLAILITMAVRGHTGSGVAALVVLTGYALQLAHRRRESVFAPHDALSSGHRTRTHLRSAAVTGDVVVAVLIATMIVQALRGAPISPYVWLAGIAGGTYLVSAVLFDHTD